MIAPITHTTAPDSVIPLPAAADARHLSGGRPGGSRDGSADLAAAALAAGQRGGAATGDDVDTAALCRLLALLADKTRMRILWLLANGERAVGAMTSELALPQPTVSHHLAWLRTMHLVSPRRAGKNVFYALGRCARVEPNGALALLTADTMVTIARRSGE